MGRPWKRSGSAATLFLLAALAACAPPTPPDPPPSSATADTDGAYAGTAQGSCGAGAATLVVKDRRFRLSVTDGPVLDGVAQPDGTLQATQADGAGRGTNFNGRIQGPELRGGSYNGRCAFAFALSRRP